MKEGRKEARKKEREERDGVMKQKSKRNRI